MSNLQLFQFNQQNIEVLFDDDEIKFSAKDIITILANTVNKVDNLLIADMELIKIEFQPKYLSFAETLCIISQYPVYKLAILCSKIIIDNVILEEWKYRYCDYWSCFSDAYFNENITYTHELYQQVLFKKVIESGRIAKFKDYKFVKPKNSFPDFVLECNGEYIVGEMKCGEFNKRNLKQLEGYLIKENISKGLAIASNLNCTLPKNIKFLKFVTVKYDLEHRKFEIT